jgi:P22 tail accessory factor
MATARDIIKSAMKKAGLLASQQDPTAAEAEDGLESLNDMGLSWSAQNVHTGWSQIGLDDDIILDDRHVEGLKFMLAERISTDYGAEPLRELSRRAGLGWQLICADYLSPENLRSDRALQFMPSQRRGWMRGNA